MPRSSSSTSRKICGYNFAHPPYNLQLSKKQLKIDKRIVKGVKENWCIPICCGKECIKINGKKAHPSQKLEDLLKRVILASTKEGDLVLDPFCGTGTTLKVAKSFKRNFIGISFKFILE